MKMQLEKDMGENNIGMEKAFTSNLMNFWPRNSNSEWQKRHIGYKK